MTLASLAPEPGWTDTLVRAAKTAVATFIGILGVNVTGYTSVPALRGAAIAAGAAGVTVIVNKILSWTSTP